MKVAQLELKLAEKGTGTLNDAEDVSERPAETEDLALHRGDHNWEPSWHAAGVTVKATEQEDWMDQLEIAFDWEEKAKLAQLVSHLHLVLLDQPLIHEIKRGTARAIHHSSCASSTRGLVTRRTVTQ